MVLRVTFSKIGDQERKQGVLPQRGHGSRDGKIRPGGGKGFGKFGRKPGFSKNKVHEVEQFEGQEDEPEDYAQEEDLEYQNDDHDSEEEDAEESGASEEEGEFLSEREASEAFMAGWKAKSQMADKKKRRGFEPVLERKTFPGGQSMSRQDVDAKKAKSRCVDCGQLGHWKGDAVCPKVKEGKTPEFKPPERKPKAINWVGMLQQPPG